MGDTSTKARPLASVLASADEDLVVDSENVDVRGLGLCAEFGFGPPGLPDPLGPVRSVPLTLGEMRRMAAGLPVPLPAPVGSVPLAGFLALERSWQPARRRVRRRVAGLLAALVCDEPGPDVGGVWLRPARVAAKPLDNGVKVFGCAELDALCGPRVVSGAGRDPAVDAVLAAVGAGV